jgi:hypothetical protein
MTELRLDEHVVIITGAHHGLGRTCTPRSVIQAGGGRVARIVLATTEGWQAPDDEPTSESILANWDRVMSGQHLREPIGSLADLLGRRGEPPYSAHDLVTWARTGVRPI